MTHPIYRVVGFEIVAPHTLRVHFDDDTAQTIDFRPVLFGELYSPLNDVNLFNHVRIDPEVHTLVSKLTKLTTGEERDALYDASIGNPLILTYLVSLFERSDDMSVSRARFSRFTSG